MLVFFFQRTQLKTLLKQTSNQCQKTSKPTRFNITNNDNNCLLFLYTTDLPISNLSKTNFNDDALSLVQRKSYYSLTKGSVGSWLNKSSTKKRDPGNEVAASLLHHTFSLGPTRFTTQLLSALVKIRHLSMKVLNKVSERAL